MARTKEERENDIRLGRLALEVLDNEAFRKVEEEVKRRLLNDMVDVKGPPEKKNQLRDEIAADIRALRSLVSKLNSMAAVYVASTKPKKIDVA